MEHQGPIVELSLSVWTREVDTCVEVDKIILFLLRMNTVKKLHLGYLRRIPLDVVMSLQQLTDLYLHDSGVHQLDTFNGFSSTTTLTIDDIIITRKTLAHLLSKCPLLKTSSLFQQDCLMYPFDGDRSSLIELFECLPMIENLIIIHWSIQCFGECDLPRKLPISLYNLKYICLYDIHLGGDYHYGMPFLALLFRACPNLKKIKLSTYTDEEWNVGEDYSDIQLNNLNELEIETLGDEKPELKFVKLMLLKSPNLEKIKLRIYTSTMVSTYPIMSETDSNEESDVGEDFSDIELKKLIEIEFESLGSKKAELEFVKLMLLKSPVLKTLRIFLNKEVAEDEELEMLNILLSCPHASPAVEITLHRDV
ncbi:F-box/FBD/LRR-repeat protein At1g13570-like isoform X2 [Rutidosis leptorrhynchoides]|uniref:F-box/FBD/LRR-repeat protein At1g13570-like isoform X2 n=1 Tax=Rutidosis leptorrhynchoides TaxID=125765 RepID=UPI003A993CF7